PGGFKRRRL
nr:Chain C, protein VII [Psittacine siadenovirus F]8SV0_E Chain E, protein VII [Psittacine siadenovirus F]